MKAVMYHYVREPDRDMPQFAFLHREDFASQLAFFEKEYGFADRDAFFAWVEDPGSEPRPPGVVLTFDDGFSDHYTSVAPILSDFGAWGIFYVPTSVYDGVEILVS